MAEMYIKMLESLWGEMLMQQSINKTELQAWRNPKDDKDGQIPQEKNKTKKQKQVKTIRLIKWKF